MAVVGPWHAGFAEAGLERLDIVPDEAGSNSLIPGMPGQYIKKNIGGTCSHEEHREENMTIKKQGEAAKRARKRRRFSRRFVLKTGVAGAAAVGQVGWLSPLTESTPTTPKSRRGARGNG